MFSLEQRSAIKWLSLPKRLRTPKTQQGLAEYLEVHPVTISKWKTQAVFKEAVEASRRDRMEDFMSDLYDVAITQALAGNDKFYKMIMDTVKDTWGKRELVIKSGVTDGQEKNMSTTEMANQMWSIIQKHNPKAMREDFLSTLGADRPPAEA